MFIFLFTLPVLRFAVASNAAGENPQNSVRAREIRRNNRVRLTLAARRLVLVMAKNSVYASYTLDAAGKPITDSIVHWVEFKCHADIALHCRFRKCIGVGISQVDWRRIGLVQHCESGFAIKYGRYGVDEAVCI